MFNNPTPDVNLPQHGEENNEGVGLKNVEKTKYFLEVEKKLINPYLVNPENYDNQEQLMNAFLHWWKKRYRKNPNTGKDYTRDLWRMAKDKYFPINWLNPNPIQIITHLDHYDDDKHPYKTINRWKATNALMRSMGINTDYWGYIPPSPPTPKVRIIPLPPLVKRLTQTKYTPNKYMNSLIQYILYQGFLIGCRPDEIPILKTTDMHFDDGYIIITELKKHSQKRQIFLEPELLNNPRRKSIKNWMTHRKTVANQQSKDILFLQPNGKPYTVNYLRKIINQYVKPIWPEYTMYVMRHWCAIARLIHSKEETGRYDTWEVKEALGHDKQATTERYLRYATKYHKIADYDWIKYLLKTPPRSQQKGLIDNYINTPWFRVEPTGVERYGPAQI